MPSEENTSAQKGHREAHPPHAGKASSIYPESEPQIVTGGDGEGAHKDTRHEKNGRRDKLYDKLNSLVRRVEVTDWIVAICTIVIAIATVVSVVIVKGQLDEMKSSSSQADQLVAAATMQANAIKDLRDLASGQLLTLQEQLGAMKKQQEITQIQMRANIRREGIVAKPVMAGIDKVGWNLNSVLRNVGGTDATDFFMIWKIFPDEPKTSDGRTCPIIIKPLDRRFPMLMTPGQPVTQAAIMLRMEDAVRAKQGIQDIYVVGRVEYRDVFNGTKTHNYAWCVHVVPHDLEKDEFSFLNVSEERD
ncbi:MAG: FlxA-like family protein [Magnetospirillum sp.]|nr:FlxA-like family protein [Magnetospirillum sp.]